ncbi:unnamed protein product [Phytophthora fragariaefolia]|uniref:Unnamed protein product n=1 Tax=Phytophthora fragariaefolia TaxID=1490495 RepID=A0A9W6U8S2_9STRA|nr:unnamed protein product [Phytophthora fragariaefolia]
MSWHSSHQDEVIDREPKPRSVLDEEADQGGVGDEVIGDIGPQLPVKALEAKHKMNLKLINIENFLCAVREATSPLVIANGMIDCKCKLRTLRRLTDVHGRYRSIAAFYQTISPVPHAHGLFETAALFPGTPFVI